MTKNKKKGKLKCTSIYFQIFTGSNIQEKYYTKSSPGQLYLTQVELYLLAILQRLPLYKPLNSEVFYKYLSLFSPSYLAFKLQTAEKQGHFLTSLNQKNNATSNNSFTPGSFLSAAFKQMLKLCKWALLKLRRNLIKWKSIGFHCKLVFPLVFWEKK